MKIPKVHTGKLDDRSKAIVYLRKEPGTKGHRLFDPNYGKIYVSKDVIFKERKGWNWNQKLIDKLVKNESFLVINMNVITQG